MQNLIILVKQHKNKKQQILCGVNRDRATCSSQQNRDFTPMGRKKAYSQKSDNCV